MKWNQADILAATHGRLHGHDFVANDVAIHTDHVKKGGIYIALKGEKSDGHLHVEKAFERGAVAVIVEELQKSLSSTQTQIVVRDSMKALVDMAKWRRLELKNTKFIALTGSVGKTTTRMMIAKALESYGSVFTSQQNYNTLIGVSVDMCRCPLGANFAVFEVGMNKPGEIDPITQLIKPDVALLTTIAENHIEYFESIEGIAYEKSQIFNGLSSKGVAVFNLDMPCLNLVAPLVQRLNNRICFSRHNSRADVFLEQTTDGKKYINTNEEECEITLNEIGDHLYSNALAAISVICALGLKIETGVKSLRSFYLPKGRGEVKLAQSVLGKNGMTIDLIDDCYNASFTSTQAALKRLKNMQSRGRKILVFGDMLELGKESQEWHLKLLPEIIDAEVNKVFCCGAFSEKLFQALPDNLKGSWCHKSIDLHPVLLESLREGDMVLVKASNGTNMRALIDLLIMEK
ncbi:MAG: hypothetical protein CMM87_05025 [Rickettsiales bacterium]|nr:hypothetical protein [Rickettsiales bacterium]|tara:strand:- start:17917 stop:19299 length:1383 start_codon:yes stop_codon:yes gene_type:complete